MKDYAGWLAAAVLLATLLFDRFDRSKKDGHATMNKLLDPIRNDMNKLSDNHEKTALNVAKLNLGYERLEQRMIDHERRDDDRVQELRGYIAALDRKIDDLPQKIKELLG
jgi:hypothetical protein